MTDEYHATPEGIETTTAMPVTDTGHKTKIETNTHTTDTQEINNKKTYTTSTRQNNVNERERYPLKMIYTRRKRGNPHSIHPQNPTRLQTRKIPLTTQQT